MREHDLNSVKKGLPGDMGERKCEEQKWGNWDKKRAWSLPL